MRHLVRSIAVIAVLTPPLAVHAAGITYSGTLTVTDTTTHTVVGSNSFSFVDPPTGGLVPFADNYSVGGSLHDGDALDLNVTFTAPGTGSGNISGTVDFLTFFSTTFNYIQWDSVSKFINLSNGSSANVVLYSFMGDPLLTLTSCEGGLCGSAQAYIYVVDNDPPATTPEPSTLALFGTGFIGIARIVRRRFAS